MIEFTKCSIMEAQFYAMRLNNLAKLTDSKKIAGIHKGEFEEKHSSALLNNQLLRKRPEPLEKGTRQFPYMNCTASSSYSFLALTRHW